MCIQIGRGHRDFMHATFIVMPSSCPYSVLYVNEIGAPSQCWEMSDKGARKESTEVSTQMQAAVAANTNEALSLCLLVH